MSKEENIVSYSLEEIKAMLARGEDLTDWARLDSMTEADLEAAIASDPDADITTAEPRTFIVTVPVGYEIQVVKKA